MKLEAEEQVCLEFKLSTGSRCEGQFDETTLSDYTGDVLKTPLQMSRAKRLVSKTFPTLAKSDICQKQTRVLAFDRLAAEIPAKAITVKEAAAYFAMLCKLGESIFQMFDQPCNDSMASALLRTESYAPLGASSMLRCSTMILLF